MRGLSISGGVTALLGAWAVARAQGAGVAFMPGDTIEWITVLLGLAAFAALTVWKWRLNVVVVVLAGGALGLLRAFAPGPFGGSLS